MSVLGKAATILSFSVLNLMQFNIYFNNQPTNTDSYLVVSNYIRPVIIYTTYLIVVAVLSVLSLNGLKEDALAGILSFIAVLITIFGLEFCSIQALEYIITHMYSLSMSAFFVSSVLSILNYIRNSYGHIKLENSLVSRTHWIETFYSGRETRPYLFGKLDLKMYLNRIAVLTLIILDIVFLCKSFLSSWSQTEFTIHKTLVVVIAFRIVYATDALIFESVFETSMEIQKEGFGYQTVVSYQVYPFLMTIMTHYIYFENIHVENWRLALMIICFVVGYLLYRISNNQIYKYRSDLSSVPAWGLIPTEYKEKKLFCLGLWGVVRHPNYLGDILIQISFSCCKLWMPAIILYIDILFIVHRSCKDNETCKKKYGRAWDKYCEKVKYILVPFVF